jgi:hypothetical protein
VRGLVALVAAVLLGLLAPVQAPLSVPSLGLLLAVLTVLAAPVQSGCLGLGLPGDGSPIGRRGP